MYFIFSNGVSNGCLPEQGVEQELKIYIAGRGVWRLGVGSRSVDRESIELQLGLYSHRSRRHRRRSTNEEPPRCRIVTLQDSIRRLLTGPFLVF